MIRFFAGKGGTGKTTCAAAEALRLSGKARTLLVSTDPAHSLGDALAVRLGSAPRVVRGKLFAAEMDADKALARWLSARERGFRAIAARGTYLDDEDIDALFRLSLPGVDELVGLLELKRLARGFEEVVVDAAPTGHTLRLLEMPETLARLAQILDDMQGKHRALALSLRGRYTRDREDALIEELQAEAAGLRAELRDPARTAFTWTMLPEEMSLLEARDGLSALGSIPVERVLVNRITPRPTGPCALCEGRRALEGEVLRAASALGPEVRMVPEQDEEPRGLSALARIVPVRVRTAKARRPRTSTVSRAESLAAAQVPRGTRLVFFGGKGGVGKTTAAAACALGVSARGERVLLLSTDPAHSLADVLQTPLSDDETEVAPGLRARELDAGRAFLQRRERYRRAVDTLFDGLRGASRFDATYDRAVVQDLIDLAPPGLDELFGLLAVMDALVAGERRFDTVVVDTAPTGHALRLLELPAKARQWVHALLEILLKYRKVIGLGDLAADLTQLSRELRTFEELLRDPARTRFIVVARAAALPVLESARLRKALSRLGIPAPAVLINARTPVGCSRCRRAARQEAIQIQALRRAAPGWAMLEAAALAPPPRGVDALRAFERSWTRSR